MMIRKTLSVLLALCIVFGLMSGAVFAEDYPVYGWAQLQAAFDVAEDGDTIYLDGDVTAETDSTMLEVTGGKSITLDLNGHTLDRARTGIDADGHVIIVRAGSTLTVTDSWGDGSGTITGGWATNGGAINNQGTLIIEGGTFTGNKAVNGGAICNRGTLTITGGVFTGNLADGDGGAIWSQSTVEIENASIIGNTASGNGGGIYLNENGTINADEVVITSNTASDGGGVYLSFADHQTYAAATLEDTTVSENTTIEHGGGGITNYGSLTMSYCTVEENHAAGSGGGVYNGNKLTMNNCEISRNVTAGLGGGVCNYGTAFCAESNITTCTISENTATDGGGIYICDDNDATGQNLGIVTIRGTTEITENTATEHGGGGIRNGNGLVIDGEIYVTDNTCLGNGGGVWNDGSIVMQGTVVISDNASTGGGGANLFLTADHTILLSGALTNSSEIHVSAQTAPCRITQHTANVSVSAGVFTSDMEDFICALRDGDVYFCADVYYVVRSWDGSQVVSEPVAGDAVIDIGTVPVNSDNVVILRNNYLYYVARDTVFAHRVEVSGGAGIILTDGNTLTCQKGIRVAEGSTLNIYGQNADSGWLIASADSYNAAIGSNDEDDGQEDGAGTIIIHGGQISATGGSDSAGIGGGNEAYGGTVTIYGGTVTAQGGENGAGVGGGDEGHTGEVTIYDGTVTAVGGTYGAGIGGGAAGDNTKIEIWGGKVTATGGDQAAGIGGGRLYMSSGGDGGEITIHGGTVSATGGKEGGAGIGGGFVSKGGTITITGGTINTTGGSCGAGIGSGGDSDPNANRDITDSVTILITGGVITAKGGKWAAGIGGGAYADAGHITIRGGYVDATGGTDNKPGVGGDHGGDTIAIEGGTVIARIVKDWNNEGVGPIGRGFNAYPEGTLTVYPGARVSAGTTESNAAPVLAAEKVSACRSDSYRYVRVESCEQCQHAGGLSYTVTADSHTAACVFCDTAFQTEAHTCDEPEWTWAEDLSAATATFTCSVCGATQTLDAAITVTNRAENVEPMEINSYRAGSEFTAPENMVYTAMVTFEDQEYTDQKEASDGYVFAGWYSQYENGEFSAPLSASDTTGTAYAKFVDAGVLTVMFQLPANASLSDETTDIRLITTVDGLDYESVGFLFGVAGKKQQKASSTRVNSRIKGTVNGETVYYYPNQKDGDTYVFAEASRYFLTRSITGIPQSRFQTDLTATAYWVTADGTTVTGATKTFQLGAYMQ